MPYTDPAERAACKANWAEANPGKVRAAHKKHYAANRERLAAYGKRHYEANKERISAYHRLLYRDNKERMLARCKRWAQANPGKVNATTVKRYAAKLQRTPPWANMKKIERAYELAAWASRFTDEPLEVDHVYPLQGKDISGLHVETNLQILPRSENRAKCNRWVE